MIPQRYLIATLFIAAMLLLVTLVQGFRPAASGGVAAGASGVSLTLDSFPPVAELRLEDGWAPRFEGAQDPDQLAPWPFVGGFGAPWEPASPYLSDQGVALNGPFGRSEVALWRGLEWRHYRFDAPLASARLDPIKGNRLLVTLKLGQGRFETRLLEVPEGRVLWSVIAGPWSRFSWDGRAALVGFFESGAPDHLLLSTLPVDTEPGEASLAAWSEEGLPAPPKGLPTRPDALSDDGRDLAGARLAIPWHAGDRLWMSRRDRLWVGALSGGWTAWKLGDAGWTREAAGPGLLSAQPPLRMAATAPQGDEGMGRSTTPADRVEWTPVPQDEQPWPAYDPAWAWGEGSALTAWDLRWKEFPEHLSAESQRAAVARAFKPDWLSACALRRSVVGWLPHGPEVALREDRTAAWAWVGDRVLLLRLPELDRLRRIRKILNP